MLSTTLKNPVVDGGHPLLPNKVRKIVFTDEYPMKSKKTTDVSKAGDGGVVRWRDGDAYYFSTQRKGVKITAPVDSRSLFSAQTELRTIDVSMLDVSQVENMNCLFYICQHLFEMKGIEDWDVSSVKHMSSMYYYCFGLRNLDQLKKWDVSNVKDTARMFFSCGNLENVDGILGWNMASADNMTEMFSACFTLPAPPTWYITWTKKFLGVDLEQEWEYHPNSYKSSDAE